MKAYAALGGIGPSSAEAGASEFWAGAGVGAGFLAAAARTGALRSTGLGGSAAAAAAGAGAGSAAAAAEESDGGSEATTTGPSNAIFGFFEPNGLASSGLKAYEALGGGGPSSVGGSGRSDLVGEVAAGAGLRATGLRAGAGAAAAASPPSPFTRLGGAGRGTNLRGGPFFASPPPKSKERSSPPFLSSAILTVRWLCNDQQRESERNACKRARPSQNAIPAAEISEPSPFLSTPTKFNGRIPVEITSMYTDHISFFI